jgi:hypothetical protein
VLPEIDALKQEDGGKLAAQILVENRHSCHPYVVKCQKRFKMKQITIYDMLIRIDNNVPPTRRPSSDRFPKKTDRKTVAKLENLPFGKIGISFRKFAKNF